MSEETEAENSNILSSLMNPSARTSGWLFSLGVWGLLLGVLNVFHLATPTGDKVVWASILSLGTVGGEYLSNNPDYRRFSDTLFLALCASGVGLGLKGILANVEGGIVGWLDEVRNSFWPSMVDPDAAGGWNSTLSAWCLIVGICFYFIMGLLHAGWVDPGVYSVAAPFVAFGVALRMLSAAEKAEGAQSRD